MNRPISSLFAIASAAAALLAVHPALAQATNSTGYTVYTQNFDGTTPTPSGITGGPGKATVAAGSSTVFKAARSANYDDSTQSAVSTVTTAGTTQTVGGTTFTNVAASGTQAANVAWAYTPTSAGPGLEGYTTSGAINQGAIVDLSSLVSFNMFVASSVPLSTVNVAIEIEENTTIFYNADTAADTSGAIPTTVSAQPDILGMRGSDGPETDIYFVGAAGTTTTGTTGFPSDGKSVVSGTWQTVTFNLPTDPHDLLLDSGTTGYRTTGLGRLYGIDFVPVSPVAGQAYSVYIDDLTIGGVAIAPAPEPSSWAAMGIGAFALLALGLRARRRTAGQMAC